MATQYRSDYEETHERRWQETLTRLLRQPSLLGDRTLALGTYGELEQRLVAIQPRLDLVTSDFDLTYAFPLASESFDSALSFEVVEHLEDQERESNDPYLGTHLFTGLMCFLVEVNRVLRPGGRFFLTTPNQSSYGSVARSVRGESTFMYWPHPRELAPLELSHFLHQAGFDVEVLDSFSPYATDPSPSWLERKAFDLLATRLQTSASMAGVRGSTMYLRARKAREPAAILLEDDGISVTTAGVRAARPPHSASE